MVTQLARVILFQFPTAIPLVDFVAFNPVDGSGQVLTQWNTAKLGAQPSQATLETIEASAPFVAFWSAQAIADRADLVDALVVGKTRAKRKAADEAFSTTAFADVADLAIQLAPNSHYEFIAYGGYTAAAAATGLQLSVSGPASPAFIRFIGLIAESVTAPRYGAGAAYDVAIAGVGSAGATPLPWELKGTISTGAQGGLLKIRARSEVNASAVTVLRGSVLKVSAVG